MFPAIRSPVSLLELMSLTSGIRIAIVSMSLACLPFGCSAARIPIEPERAKALLETVLTAWQKGGSCEELRSRTPAIHVADEQWLGRAILLDFSILPGESFGTGMRFPVTLTGKSLSRSSVFYLVSTHPVLSVTLAD